MTGMVFATMFPPPVTLSSRSNPLGRRRESLLHLPPRMHMRGTSYYYVSSGRPRKWTLLGSDLGEALRKWAELENPRRSQTVADLCRKYISVTRLGEATRKQYESYVRTIEEAFPVAATSLRKTHVALWRDLNAHRPGTANGVLALLSATWGKAQEWGQVEADVTVTKIPQEVRDKLLTDAEFAAIRAKAPEWLQVTMDLAYLTAARPSDVLSLKWEQVGEYLSLRQKKTKQRQAFVLAPALLAVLERARNRRVLGLYVVADRNGKPISYDSLNRAWIKAREAAGVDAQFRDIRAYSGTEAEKMGQDFQALLGHTSRKMSERYLKGKRTIIVEPLLKTAAK